LGGKICYTCTGGKDFKLKLKSTKFKNLFIVEIEPIKDNRGFFARIWDKKIFQENGLDYNFVQSSISHNLKKGTLRGIHYQVKPYEEAKLVNCIKGKIFDVVIDLRPNSKTYLQKFEIELNSNYNEALFIPEGFAHGFQTLENNTEILYQVSQFYSPNSEKGIRWNDPTFKIKWPYKAIDISEKDQNWNLFEED